MHTGRTCKLIAAMVLATLAVGCAGVVYAPNFSYPDAPCRMENGFCVIDVPGAGHLLVQGSGTSEGNSTTWVTVEFSPLDGMRARWSHQRLTVVDLNTQQVIERPGTFELT